MEKNPILKALKELREKSPKRNFSQSIDVLINLKNLDLKKPEHKLDIYTQLPRQPGKKIKVCALVDAQLASKAEKICDTVIQKPEFEKWKDKKLQRNLANNHDFFISQVEVMAQVAATFGKVLGSRGKMPNPKAGCVVPGNIPSIEPIVQKLQKTVRLQTKNELSIKARVGTEDMKDEDLAENILAVYTTVLSNLPQEKNNVRYLGIKFTMGQLFKIEEEVRKK